MKRSRIKIDGYGGDGYGSGDGSYVGDNNCQANQYNFTYGFGEGCGNGDGCGYGNGEEHADIQGDKTYREDNNHGNTSDG